MVPCGARKARQKAFYLFFLDIFFFFFVLQEDMSSEPLEGLDVYVVRGKKAGEKVCCWQVKLAAEGNYIQ